MASQHRHDVEAELVVLDRAITTLAAAHTAARADGDDERLRALSDGRDAIRASFDRLIVNLDSVGISPLRRGHELDRDAA